MNKSILRLCSLLVAGTMLFSGCTNTSQSSSSSTTTSTSVVRINIPAEPDNLHPWKSAASDTEAVFFNVFDGLVSFDEKGSLLPGLADSWDVSPDGLQYTFHLKKDVVFHNDEKMTSADVLYTYNTLTGLGGEAPLTTKFQNIKKISAPDEYTVVMELGTTSASFLGLNTVAILPKDYNQQETHPIGTGPFSFVEYTPGQRIVLQKNEKFYDKNAMAKIDKAEIYIMSEPSAVVSALQSGQLDIASVTPQDATLLNKEFDIYTSPQNMVQIFALNNQVAPFNDKKVRQAVNYAVNKQEIIDGAFGGYGTALTTNFSPVMEVYHDASTKEYDVYDPEKAKALLAETPYANGFEMTITVPGNYKQHVSTAEIVAQQLKPLGITVKINTIEWGVWLDQVYAKADYQSTIIGLTGKLDPHDVLIRFDSTYKKNFVKFQNAEYDAAITAAGTELDQEKRIGYYKECQQILSREYASVFVCDPNLTVASRKDLKGYTFYPLSYMDLTKLSYDKQQ